MGDWNVTCPENAFYNQQYLTVDDPDTSGVCEFSSAFQVHGDETPFHKPCIINTTNHFGDKSTLLLCRGDKIVSYGGSVKDNIFSTKIYSWGTYQLHKDTVAPSLRLKYFPSTIIKGRRVSWLADDDLDEKAQVMISDIWELSMVILFLLGMMFGRT